MSKVQKYAIEALASSGFAVLNSKVAYTMRPDLWSDALGASIDLGDKSLPAKLNAFGCLRYLARLDGIEGTVKVLARSGDDLAKRIGQVTGFRVVSLALEPELRAAIGPVPPRRVVPNADPRPGDLHADVKTKEPARTCTVCEWLQHGGGCSNSSESMIQRPQPNAPRRCKGYRPVFESYDGRIGRTLWPELF